MFAAPEHIDVYPRQVQKMVVDAPLLLLLSVVAAAAAAAFLTLTTSARAGTYVRPSQRTRQNASVEQRHDTVHADVSVSQVNECYRITCLVRARFALVAQLTCREPVAVPMHLNDSLQFEARFDRLMNACT